MKDDFEAEDIKERLIEVLTAPVLIGDSYKKIAMNILVARRFETLQSVDEMLLLMKIKGKQFYNLGIDQILEVTEADAEKCRRYTFIEKNLLDIRYSRDIDDERVLVYVQPIYDITTGKFRTGESLMRLKIDDEIIYPDEFIPIAENSGSIHSLTRIMLYKVSKKIAELSENYDFDAITVNVSTVEMAIPNVSEEFMGIIMRTHASPEKIRFEVTESTNIKNYAPVISNIKRINELGVCFYLDDFGTGYSNLDRVISIPFMTIKFDKSLLYKSMEDKKSEELLMFMVRFFKSNDYKLVIEGVEDVIQKEYVERIGFDYIQGYLYSRPMPIDEIDRFFTKKSID